MTSKLNIFSESSQTHTATDRTPYTYLIGWSQHDKWYYGRRTAKGCHPTDLWKSYFTSSNHVKKFREEHGEPDVIQIRRVFDSVESCSTWEETVLARLDAAHGDKWLNKTNGDRKFNATGMVVVRGNEGNLIRISKSDERYISGELKFHYAGRIPSQETIEKCRIASTGKLHTQETKDKCRNINLGKTLSDETKEKLRKAKTGTTMSVETKEKMSAMRKGKSQKGDGYILTYLDGTSFTFAGCSLPKISEILGVDRSRLAYFLYTPSRVKYQQDKLGISSIETIKQ